MPHINICISRVVRSQELCKPAKCRVMEQSQRSTTQRKRRRAPNSTDRTITQCDGLVKLKAELSAFRNTGARDSDRGSDLSEVARLSQGSRKNSDSWIPSENKTDLASSSHCSLMPFRDRGTYVSISRPGVEVKRPRASYLGMACGSNSGSVGGAEIGVGLCCKLLAVSEDSLNMMALRSLYELTVYDNLFVGILMVFRGKPGLTSSRPRMFMFGITTFMFVLGIIALVLETSLGFQQFQTFYVSPSYVLESGWSVYRINVAFAVEAIFTRLMINIDIIITSPINQTALCRISPLSLSVNIQEVRPKRGHSKDNSHFFLPPSFGMEHLRLRIHLGPSPSLQRAVVLWNRDKRVIAILLLFVLGTTEPRTHLRVPPTLLLHFSNWTNHRGFGSPNHGWPNTGNQSCLHQVDHLEGLATPHLRKHLGEGTGSVRVEKVFALLIESGFLYCCLWSIFAKGFTALSQVLYLVSALNVIPQPSFTVMEHVLVFASGLYPTLIIILVAMQKSPIEHYSTYSTRMQFAGGPALGPARTGDQPRHVYYSVRREYANNSDTHIPSMVLMNTPDEKKGL
ncbi:hypothetical protein EDB87DRAFT_1711764 [Lactarius vividus]|nr:hypothetical protein EDB87DRAFT_1711764 [Lactarius vividus]